MPATAMPPLVCTQQMFAGAAELKSCRGHELSLPCPHCPPPTSTRTHHTHTTHLEGEADQPLASVVAQLQPRLLGRPVRVPRQVKPLETAQLCNNKRVRLLGRGDLGGFPLARQQQHAHLRWVGGGAPSPAPRPGAARGSVREAVCHNRPLPAIALSPAMSLLYCSAEGFDPWLSRCRKSWHAAATCCASPAGAAGGAAHSSSPAWASAPDQLSVRATRGGVCAGRLRGGCELRAADWGRRALQVWVSDSSALLLT